MEFKQPVIGRPPAPLPYRTTQPDGDQLNDSITSDNTRFEGGAIGNINTANGVVGGNVILGGEQQEEPQYVTPLPADDLFEGVDAELLKDAERFGRRDSEPMLIDDGRHYIEDDDDAEEDEDVARAFGGDEDPKDDEEEGEEEEDFDDDNGEEIVLEADRKQSDPEEDEEANQLAGAQANALMVNSNGIVPSYNWK